MNANIIHVSDPWFDQIRCVEKIVEGRLLTEKYKSIGLGDEIIISGPRDVILNFIVVKLVYARDFGKLIDDLGLTNILPGVDNRENGIKIYSEFYSDAEIEKYGVVGIYIKK
jgi:ASC-1-like (ASCH) protein